MTIVGPNGQPARNVEVPEHIKEGLETFYAWASARSSAGDPLPPGGMFILSKDTILADEITKLRMAICSELKIGLECVKVLLERDDFGRLMPSVEVDPPDGWIEEWSKPGFNMPIGEQSPEEYARDYITGVRSRAYQRFKETIVLRVGLLVHDRPDLQPSEIIDALAESTDDQEETNQ